MFCKREGTGACAVGEIVRTELWIKRYEIWLWWSVWWDSSVRSYVLVLWCVSIEVRQMKVTSVNRQCVCIECIHYGRSEVSFDVLRLEGREGSIHFLGSLLFCHNLFMMMDDTWLWLSNTKWSYFLGFFFKNGSNSPKIYIILGLWNSLVQHATIPNDQTWFH
jgi:hypothetical protein